MIMEENLTKVDLNKFGSLIRITHDGYRVQIPWENINQLIIDLKKIKDGKRNKPNKSN